METIGVLFFLLIAGMAFWVLIFLATFLPYIIGGYKLDIFFPKLADKIFGEGDPNAVRSYPVAGEEGYGAATVEVKSETIVEVSQESTTVVEETEVTITSEESDNKPEESSEQDAEDNKEE